MKTQRRTDLDVVRGFAILLAMGWHINEKLTGFAPLDILLLPGHLIGWAGVDVFFVLSGFLVGGNIFQEIDHTGGFNYIAFSKRRIMRLWPTLYTFLIFMFVLGHMGWLDVAKIALHVQNYFDPKSATHTWSLAVEEQFYVLFALFLPQAAKAIGVRSRRMIAALAGVMVLCLVLRRVAFAFGADPLQIHNQTEFRLDGLACGVLLAHLSLFEPDRFKAIAAKKRLWAGVAAASAVYVGLVGKVGLEGETAGLTASYVMGAALLLLAYDSGVERWAKTASREMAFVGQIAYTLYLFHVPVYRSIFPWMTNHVAGSTGRSMAVVASYAASIIVAWTISVCIERPIMALRDRTKSSAGETPAAVAVAE